MRINSYIAMKDKLSKEYREAFDFIEHYGEMHFIGEDTMGEKMMDLMDIMLTAQEVGRSVEEITGKNIEDFCKNFFSDVTLWDMLKDRGRIVCAWAWFVFVFESLGILIEIGANRFDLFTYSTSVDGYLVGIAIAWVGIIVADIVGIILAKFGNYSKKIYTCVAVVSTTVCIVAGIVFIANSDGINVPAYIVASTAALYLLIYYAMVFYTRFKKTGSFKKPSDAYHTTFSDMVRQEAASIDYTKDKSIVRAFAKRYKRKNARLMKKGKPRMTTAEFLAREEKQSSYGTKIGFGVGLLISLFGTVGADILNHEQPFDGILDIAIYVLLMAIVLALLYKFFKKLDKVASAERHALLEACQREGIELDEFCDMLLAGKFDCEKDD